MMTPQQKKENAIKWIDELAVTDLLQGRGRLGNFITGLDCMAIGHLILNIDHDENQTISKEMTREVGLISAGGSLLYQGLRTSLISLNDQGKTFKEIHQIILDNLETLFIPEVSSLLVQHYRK